MYFIGIDGGGNYSRIIGADESKTIIGSHNGNSTNLAINSYDIVRHNIKTLVTEFNKLTNTKISDCKAVCIGSAGINTKESAEKMEAIFRLTGFTCPLKVVNNAELVLAAETKGKPGVAVIAGIDSIAVARDKNGVLRRAGGYGYLIDDAGSGYWMGMQAIKHALMSDNGVYGDTVLKKTLFEHFKADSFDKIVEYVYSDSFNRSKVSELALLIKYTAVQGDEISLIIEEKAAFELFKLADVLLSQYNLSDTTVVLSGSVLLLNDRIRKKLVDLLYDKYDGLTVIKTNGKPEMGAIYLASMTAEAHSE